VFVERYQMFPTEVRRYQSGVYSLHLSRQSALNDKHDVYKYCFDVAHNTIEEAHFFHAHELEEIGLR